VRGFGWKTTYREDDDSIFWENYCTKSRGNDWKEVSSEVKGVKLERHRYNWGWSETTLQFNWV
jgi:hypothetical protein